MARIPKAPLLLFVVIISPYLIGNALPQAHAMVLRIRELIIIRENGGFTAANGVVAGAGTANDPYVIEGWEINDGIFLLNTSAFVIIRNVFVHSGYFGIELYSSRNVRVENATLTDNSSGVRIEHSTNITVTGSKISYSRGSEVDGGITVLESKGVSISNNVISSNAWWGLRTDYSEVSIHGNIIRSSLRDGIETYESNVTIIDNVIQSNDDPFGLGIDLGCGTRAIIARNRLTNNTLFINCDSELRQNGMRVITPDNTVNGKPLLYYEGCGNLHFDRTPIGQLIVAGCNNVTINHVSIDRRGSSIFAAFVNNISVRNSSFTNDGSLAIVGVKSNVTITGSYFSNGTLGAVYIGGARRVTFERNVVQFNYWAGFNGIAIEHGEISQNIFRGNGYGLYLSDSHEITISDNNVVSNTLGGVSFFKIFNSTVSHNRVSGNYGHGIDLEFSSNITVVKNSFASNTKSGLRLYSSSFTTVTRNHFTRDGISMDFGVAPHNVVTPDNLLNRNPILYYETCPSKFEVSNAPLGQLIVVNCQGVQISKLKITDAYEGIQLLMVSNATLTNVDVSKSWSGIHVMNSRNVQVTHSMLHSSTNGILFEGSSLVSIQNSTITGNSAGIVASYSAGLTITGNQLRGNGYGITIGTNCCSAYGDRIVGNDIRENNFGLYVSETCCATRMIYHNNFVGNKYQLIQETLDGMSQNRFDNGYPDGGNYWSDYKGVDNCSGPNQDVCTGPDGIGDTPRIIDTISADRYPLMRPIMLVAPEILQSMDSARDAKF